MPSAGQLGACLEAGTTVCMSKRSLKPTVRLFCQVLQSIKERTCCDAWQLLLLCTATDTGSTTAQQQDKLISGCEEKDLIELLGLEVVKHRSRAHQTTLLCLAGVTEQQRPCALLSLGRSR
jgi:hypothetical protein